MKNPDQSDNAGASPLSVERVLTRMEAGLHAQAYADALVLLGRQPEHPVALDVFVQAAACAERQDEAGDVLRGLRHHIQVIGYAVARTKLSLLAGDAGSARRHAGSIAFHPDAATAYPDLMIAIAEREDNPEAALRWMRERERRTANIPFAWALARWQIQGLLGQHDEVIRETSQLEPTIPGAFPAERRVIRLQRAMAHHNALRFGESMMEALDLADELVKAGPLPPAPRRARMWTRRRQNVVAGEIEKLALLRDLPMAAHAGTLLALIREGDFFPGDQDFDLAAIPPATSAMMADALIATGAFRARPQALDAGSFRTLGHIATGLAVDVTEYQREGDLFVSTWRHASGVVLRRSATPAFAVRMVDHHGVGRRLPLPDAPEDQLRATYGDWQTPNGDFDTLVEAPNILEFTDFLRSVAAIRLADGMLSGRQGPVRRLAQRLLADGVASELMERIINGPA